MYQQRYKTWAEYLQAHHALLRALIGANRLLTYLGYFMFPLLLVFLAIFQRDMLVPTIFTAGIAFVMVSAFRELYNAPRPYECGIEPLICKDTPGKSFPSRHTFCMFMIALCWLRFAPVVGALLLIAGVFMGIVRVLGGVHFPKDVVAGAVVGILAGIVGLWIV